MGNFQKLQSKREILWRKDGGNFYVEDGRLILNAPYPQLVQAGALEDIDLVDVYYETWYKKRGLSFAITLTIVKKDGSSCKEVNYFSSRRKCYSPEEMVEGLEALGLRCTLPSGTDGPIRRRK